MEIYTIVNNITTKLMENRKTAMQELFDNLEAIDIIVPIGVKQIFIKKEKEQIIEANFEGQANQDEGYPIQISEQYYNEQFKNK